MTEDTTNLHEHDSIVLGTIPYTLAHTVTLATAQSVRDVGEYVTCIELGDGVFEYHFQCLLRGYECWHWVTTLYHDEENGTWTVDETTLQPAQGAILAPEWIPWKDRLKPDDLSPVDVLGTDPHDSRMESGVGDDEEIPLSVEASENTVLQEDDVATDNDDTIKDTIRLNNNSEHSQFNTCVSNVRDDTLLDHKNMNVGVQHKKNISGVAEPQSILEKQHIDSISQLNAKSNKIEHKQSSGNIESTTNQKNEEDVSFKTTVSKDALLQKSHMIDQIQKEQQEEYHNLVETFQLTRRHVMTAESRMETAQRWYEGPPGPKSLSTRTAQGEVCSNCAFFVPLQGDLQRLFGVCANKWSPEDAKVVAIDHGCGEHSEIEPAEPTQLWIQSDPAYDSIFIDVVAQVPREENDEIEMIEENMTTNDKTR